MKFEFQKFFAYCIDGNIRPALDLLESYDHVSLSEKELTFKTEFENRFKFSTDSSNYRNNETPPLSDLLKLYVRYWRESVLDISGNYEQSLMNDVSDFLKINFPPAEHIEPVKEKLDIYLKDYITSLGFYTTGFGKTGKYFDLLVWKTEEEKNYSFKMHEEETNVKVVFMDDFITLGWEEYATLGKLYPGGWATKESLFCVKKAYDTESENFKISYLAHESRHFADYKLFPKLKSTDLEYRAKLTELSLLKNNLYNVIAFFISNSNYDSDNGHSVANYCVIRDLSEKLFGSANEIDINKWKEVSIDKINESAYQILQENTIALKKIGDGVEKFIKN